MAAAKNLILEGWFWFFPRAADVCVRAAQCISQLLLSNKPPPKFSGLKQEPLIVHESLGCLNSSADVGLAWLILAGLPQMSCACWVTGCRCHCLLIQQARLDFHMVAWKQVRPFEVWARKYHFCCSQLVKANSSDGEIDSTS